MAVCVCGVIGMIASAATKLLGGVLTFGVATAIAVLCLLVATAVGDSSTAEGAEANRSDSGGHPNIPNDQALRVEEKIAALLVSGADETEVRDLVREAVSLGKVL